MGNLSHLVANRYLKIVLPFYGMYALSRLTAIARLAPLLRDSYTVTIQDSEVNVTRTLGKSEISVRWEVPGWSKGEFEYPAPINLLAELTQLGYSVTHDVSLEWGKRFFGRSS
ncbi:hypothetical protein A3K63_02770 [Candidatus Micrarchaeota archaeon RBG_16_49_10]|nr:MAG: hypothetical protein A3K63_02770 [Candidatus Micrarchaeota archaeon RBG_16_49_10]